MSGLINLLPALPQGTPGPRSAAPGMGLISVPVFTIQHEFLRLKEKNSARVSKFNCAPDSILFHEDVYRFFHSGSTAGCSQRVYITTGDTP